MNEPQGWIKLHRSMLEWEWYDDPNVFRVWMHLLLKAQHRDSKYKGKVIPAGSLVGGYPALSEQTGLTVQKVRTAIRKLKSTGELTVQSTALFSIITITKWSEYQQANSQSTGGLTAEQQASNRLPTGDQQAINRQLTTSKEVNNVIREECNNEIKDLSVPIPAEPQRAKSPYPKEFDDLWKGFLPYNRKGDNKAEALKRYSTAKKQGYSIDDLKVALNALARLNRDMAFGGKDKGMAFWLYPANIQSALDGEFDVQQQVETQAERIERDVDERFSHLFTDEQQEAVL